MTGAFDFDPDRFLRPEQPAASVHPLHDMPEAWAHGLHLLADRVLPKGASEARWQQILADAKQIAIRYSRDALAARWDLPNLFGYDPRQPERCVGLAVRMRGRYVVAIRPEHAVIRADDGYIYHRPEMPADAPLLWNFSEVKATR